MRFKKVYSISKKFRGFDVKLQLKGLMKKLERGHPFRNKRNCV